ncbi:peptidyl-prolyl cis-trans isomerase [Haliea sp. E17]|uniref:peptidylprolyl isomerase n=1 Tax=Haliea sp. E17 TaxID=3401576 RepID=UPI003AAAFB9C
MSSISRILKEPLLHFLAMGALLFVLYAWVNPGQGGGEQTIVVDAGRIALLRAHFERTWNRPPSATEMQALVDNFVVEEIFYRQALELGLDQNDEVIRRRLRQKVEFITADALALYEPSEAELADYLQAHPDKFRHDAVYSFEQLYFSPDHGAGDALRQRVTAAREALLAGESVSGDTTLLPRAMSAASASQVDRNFGEGFAESLDALTPGEWSQPLASGLGLHLVRLTARQPAYLPQLDAVRAEVQREWQRERNEQAREALVADLKSGYKVIVEDGDGAQG